MNQVKFSNFLIFFLIPVGLIVSVQFPVGLIVVIHYNTGNPTNKAA